MAQTRIYNVRMKSGKRGESLDNLVEATSQEAAIRAVTSPMVESCTIPTGLELIRLQKDGAKMHGSLAPEPAAADDEPGDAPAADEAQPGDQGTANGDA